jgi:hypothetical protein
MKNEWTYVLKVFFSLYWFTSSSETDFWENNIYSEGLDFMLQTDQ